MDILFLSKCYFIGLLSTLGLGPIFILTFNRAAVYGFIIGLFTGFGAAFSDGLLFAFGMMGVLAFLAASKNFILILDLIGGVFLLILGINSFRKKIQVENGAAPIKSGQNLFFVPVKAFLMSFINPMNIAFFAFWSMKVLPQDASFLHYRELLEGSGFVFLGTLSGLSLVSFAASFLGLAITPKGLERVSKITGMIFVAIGIYLFWDFGSKLLAY
ncbi:TPA: hypothetical protein DEO28_04110 [Candidatus Dependentiae bacterium]|nr:MAG: Lysine exporter protein LysE/YggA [candidate division TM6 bacterium GW2011_GWE2_31_21]KKP53518.1 MAG: Lysine exporter protein LysE/YggA [candidate division TM6 bacterium GW2011_GWF2_33_332]HBS48241.1 hypothetical protein [Candidatus Dependentiae bacterium]HBZ73667.1 hypothetical protein [Candidatus Dependentiae bacterium]